MQSISIIINDKAILNRDIEMQPNTVYSFFNSILIDELTSLNEHIIYADANALEENKTPFFIGEQLLMGDVLITGKSLKGDVDSTITPSELEELVSYEVSSFYQQTLSLLSQTDVNLYKIFQVVKNDETLNVNIEWVLYTFNIADERTQEYFLNEVGDSLIAENTQKILEKMAQLAMNAS